MKGSHLPLRWSQVRRQREGDPARSVSVHLHHKRVCEHQLVKTTCCLVGHLGKAGSGCPALLRGAGAGPGRRPVGLCEVGRSWAKTVSPCMQDTLARGAVNREDLVPCWWRPVPEARWTEATGWRKRRSTVGGTRPSLLRELVQMEPGRLGPGRGEPGPHNLDTNVGNDRVTSEERRQRGS